MQQLIEWLKELSYLGLDLWLEDGRLRYRAPDGVITSAQVAELKAHRTEIIALLTQDPDAIKAYPLSHGQRALWFIHESDASAAYNLAFAARIHSTVDITALEITFQQLAERHPLLRSHFPQWSNGPVRELHAIDEIDFAEIDASAWSDETLRKEIATEQHAPFDLQQGPVMRMRLFTVAPQQHVLLWVIHHIVCDGHSIATLLDEFRQIYPALTAGQPIPLAPLPHQYQEYVRWQQQMLADKTASSEGEQLWSFWQEQLGEQLSVIDLPVDHVRPPIQTYRGDAVSFTLDESRLQQVKQLAAQESTTPYGVLLAAFQLLLHRYTGQEEILVGSPTAGRTHSEFANVVGYFVNPVVLRAAFADDLTFQQLLAQVGRQAMAAVSHQDFPFSLLVERLQPTRDPSRSPIFQVAYLYQRVQQQRGVARLMVPDDPTASVAWGGLLLTPIELVQQAGVFDLEFEIHEGVSHLRCWLKYKNDLFDRATIARMADHFQTMVRAILADPTAPILSYPLLSADETQQLLVDWNATERSYPLDHCLHHHFEAQVARTPDVVAVRFDDGSGQEANELTYRELDARANQLAHHLQSLGVGSPSSVPSRAGTRESLSAEVLVGIAVERSLEMVIGLYAILKAGGAYVPLDPSYPAERLASMMADAGAPVLLTQAHLVEQLPTTNAQIICLDRDWPQIATQPTTRPACAVTADNLAYMIYTSGSTGKPKGAMNTHRGICNRLLWMQEEYQLESSDHILQKTPFSFDVSVWEFFWPLMVGARLVVAKPEGHKDPDYLVSLIQREEITTLHFVPPMLQAFLYAEGVEACDSLRRVICSGEALPMDLQRRFFTQLEKVELHNLYGPTEAAIDVTYWRCQPDDNRTTVPIGRPVANTQIYILDRQMQPVPIGVAGELYIGGVQVGRGYHNRSELTADKFVADPFVPESDAKLYRTGDLARHLADGTIEFLGRIDHQVKLRGFRIELGEIEAALVDDPAVREAVVLLRDDVVETAQLVAYIVPTEPTAMAQSTLTSSLRQRLATSLPDYMIPTHFLLLAALPLSPNGKLDRKALPMPEQQRHSDEYVAPQSDVEEILAAIWRDVLKQSSIGIHDNFFALGGDSILSIQVVAKAKQRGIGLTVQQLFQHQTIGQLAAVAQSEITSSATQTAVVGLVPLTPIQRWFFAQNQPEPDHFNQSILLEISSTIVPTRLEKALHALLDHHDALRLRFRKGPTGWQQENLAPGVPFQLTVVDVADLSPSDLDRRIEETATAAQASLRLTDGELMRAVLFQKGADQPSLLLLAIHHLAVDGISWRILLEDLTTAYEQLSTDETIAFPPKSTSYQAWADHLIDYAEADVIRDEIGFWLNTLPVGIPTMPLDPLPAASLSDVQNCESTVNTVTITLAAKETTLLLQEVPSRYNTRTDDLLLTALCMAYSQWSGDDRLFIDIERHGREELFSDVDLSRTVGWFTSISPVLLQFEQGCTAAPGEAIKAIKEQLRQVPRQGIGYGLLRYLSSDDAIRAAMERLPQPQILFNYLGQFGDNVTPSQPFPSGGKGQTTPSSMSGRAGEGLKQGFHLLPASVGLEHSPQTVRSYLLEINAFVLSGQLHVQWRYSRHLHNAATIGMVAANFLEHLHTLIAHCQSPDAGGYTKSDFPYAPVDEQEFGQLAALLEQMG